MIRPLYLGSEIYRHSLLARPHPLAIPRVSVATDLCRAMGWLDDTAYRTAPVADATAVLRFHTPEYVAALAQAEALQSVDDGVRRRHGLGTGDNPVYPEMYRRPMTGAGGLMMAAELTATGQARIVHCPGGGTHHGRPDRAAGFCYLNDVVLGLLVWRELGLRRIAYVDIDAHHGDGVQQAFADEPDVLTISVHEALRWPARRVEAGGDARGSGLAIDRAGGAARNLPVEAGFNDSEMAWLADRAILPLVEDHRPQAIFLQCGADALEDDPLSRLGLSNRAHARLAGQLRDAAARLEAPLIVSGGGGYNPYSTGRCWAVVWATLAGLAVATQASAEAEAVLRALIYPRAIGRNPPPHWLTTLLDAPREGPVRASVRALAAQALQP